jgi:hypothetical protein
VKTADAAKTAEVELENSSATASGTEMPPFKHITLSQDEVGLLWLPSWFKSWIFRLFG